MSVHKDKDGKIVIRLEDWYGEEDLYNAQKAIIELIQQRGEDFTHYEPLYHVTRLLEQTLLDEAQIKKALSA